MIKPDPHYRDYQDACRYINMSIDINFLGKHISALSDFP